MTSTLDELLSSDIWDTRDLIQLIDELDPDDEDDARDLERAKVLAEELEGYAEDFKYGACVIADDHFEQYAQEFASDIGAIEDSDRWPGTHIDWTAAANDLKQDYMEFEFEGVTWLVR